MHKTFEFKNSFAGVEPRFAALILFERMQFADVEKPARSQNFIGLPKYKIYILDVFERETASYQIKLIVGKLPIAAQIELSEFNGFRRDFFFRFGEHFSRKISRNEMFGFHRQPFGIFSRSASDFQNIQRLGK